MSSQVALRPSQASVTTKNEAPSIISSRTSTEKKTYALVIGKILKVLSIAIGVASIVGCFVVSSVAAFGFIPAVALGILGLYLTDEKKALVIEEPTSSSILKVPSPAKKPKPISSTHSVPKKPTPSPILPTQPKPSAPDLFASSSASTTPQKPVPVTPPNHRASSASSALPSVQPEPKPESVNPPSSSTLDPKGSVKKDDKRPFIIDPDLFPPSAQPEQPKREAVNPPLRSSLDKAFIKEDDKNASSAAPSIQDKEPSHDGTSKLGEEISLVPKNPVDDKQNKPSSPIATPSAQTKEPITAGIAANLGEEISLKPKIAADEKNKERSSAPGSVQGLSLLPERPTPVALPPVGLRNASCNCWINSLLQLFINTPSLNRTLRCLPVGVYDAILDVMDQYEAAQAKGDKVAAANSQTIRVLLHDMTRDNAQSISPYSGKQEDANEGMMFLLRDVLGEILNNDVLKAISKGNGPVLPAPFFVIEETYNKKSHFNPEFLIRLDPVPGQRLTFSEMLRNFFQDPTIHETRDAKDKKWNYLQSAPPELLFQFKRFYREGESNKKYTKRIEIPLEFQMPVDYISSKEQAVYACDGFIVHIGKTMSSGHYECYLKRGDQWFRISDSTWMEVTASDAQTALQKAYISHFKKKD